MSSASHAHPVDPGRVRDAQGAALSLADGERLGELLALLSDASRIRILFALASVDELCVSDLAGLLGISASAASHQLRLLRDRRLVEVRREGKRTFYRLQDEHIRTLVGMGISHAAEDARGAAVRLARAARRVRR